MSILASFYFVRRLSIGHFTLDAFIRWHFHVESFDRSRGFQISYVTKVMFVAYSLANKFSWLGSPKWSNWMRHWFARRRVKRLKSRPFDNKIVRGAWFDLSSTSYCTSQWFKNRPLGRRAAEMLSTQIAAPLVAQPRTRDGEYNSTENFFFWGDVIFKIFDDIFVSIYILVLKRIFLKS